jgi:hypothetical protein
VPDPIFVLDIGPDGVVATHPARVELPKLVAPVPEDRVAHDFNTVRPELMVIGCMRLNETPGFEFDSSLIGPGAVKPFTRFAELMKALQKHDPDGQDRLPPVSVFGHADPTGPPAYNKTLSGRRARSVYAVLVRRVAIWDELYRNPHGGDRWSYKAIQLMLSVSLRPDEPAFYGGPVDGAKTPETQRATRDAVRSYQEARGLPQTGFANDATRAKLFAEYMDFLAHDAGGAPFRLDPTRHFIAKHRDRATLKGDVQGCGEFNPLSLPTKEDQDRWDKAKDDDTVREERNAAFAGSRRVTVYVFRHGTEIDPRRWPCPPSDIGVADCQKRFWADDAHRVRREPGFERKFEDSRDTMRCRFYHAFAVYSPCEAGVRRWRVRFRTDAPKPNDDPLPLKDRRFVVRVGAAAFALVMRGRTDDDGEIVIPAFEEKATITVKLDVWGALVPADAASDADPPPAGDRPATGFDTDAFPDEDGFATFTLDAGTLRSAVTDDKEAAGKQRLYNLGFGANPPLSWDADELRRAVKQYRRTRHGKRGVTEGDVLDDVTVESLRQEHDVEGPEPPAPPPDEPAAPEA